MHESVAILGVKVHKICRSELEAEIDHVFKLSKDDKPIFIATVNPSFIMKAQHNPTFRGILNNVTTLNVSDGVGLRLADPSLEVITGVDITKMLLNKANKLGKSVLIIHRKDSLLTESVLVEHLLKKYPNLCFKVISLSNKGHIVDNFKLRYDLLLCTFGEVTQEMFIAHNIPYLKPKIAIGIGGSFDILCGIVKDADSHNFKWLYRLISNPKRLSKTIRSVVIFPVLLVTDRIRSILWKKDTPLLKTP